MFIKALKVVWSKVWYFSDCILSTGQEICFALAGVAQCIECRSAKQRVTGSIPSLGHMPGLWARFPVGRAQEATTH